MKLLIALSAATLIGGPALANQSRTAADASVWGRPAMQFQDRFDAAARRAGLAIRADSLVCETAPRFRCQGDIRGVRMQISGQTDPEAVQEIRIIVDRNAPAAVLASVTRVVLAIAEPAAAEVAQRDAAQRLLGVGRPAEDRVVLGGTEARFRDAFRDAAIVLSPVR